MLRAINIIGYVLLQFKLMREQLASAAILSSWLLISLTRPPLVAPLIPACACVATFSFECETSLRDTTSAANILNLASCSSHHLCCNLDLFDQIIANWSLRGTTTWIYRRILNEI